MDIRGFFSNKAPSVATPSKPSSAEVVPPPKPIISMKESTGSLATSVNINAKSKASEKNNIVKSKRVIEDDEDTQVCGSVATNKVTEAISEKVVSSSDTLALDIKDIATWKSGDSVPYSALAETFESVSKVSGRLEKENLFTRLFRAVILTTPNDLEAIVYLSSNEVAPAYEGLELGIGDSLLVKAICAATGRTKDAVEEAYQREGDLGTVALASRSSQKTLSFGAKPKPLTVTYILEQLRVISKTKGDKAQGRKVDIIKSIMDRCAGCEAKYVIRALQGKLRIGTAAQTILVAVAHAFAITAHKGQTPSSDNNHTSSSSSASSSSSSSSMVEGGEYLEEEEEHGVHPSVVDEETGGPAADQSASDSSASAPAVASLSELVHSVEESEPPEAKKLREGGRQLPLDTKKELAVIAIKRAFSECPNLGILLKALTVGRICELYRTCRLVPGVPVAPMLAKPTKEVGEVLRRLSGLAFTMEYKYDGERAQVHLLENGSVKIFSRNSEDNTEKYPDLMEVIRKARTAGVQSCVLDCEVVAYDREKGCLLPFQVLSTRKRKVDEGEEDNTKVKVVLQAFDMIYINSKSLLRCTLRQRRTLLHTAFTENVGYFHFASGMDHVENGDTEPIEIYMQEACGAMCEGLMVKTLDSNASYEASKRSLNWLKLKKDYIDGMGVCDSVDLVVIGGYMGRGKRCQVYGAYLMACYDPEKDEFQSVCKVGTGFKDEDLVRLTDKMKALTLQSHRRPVNYNVEDVLEPDDWFQPQVVWELQAADLSKSSVHKGAVGKVDSTDASRGVGLRFPRYIRDREDKKATGATTSEQIADMYFSQGEVENKPTENNDDDDFI